MDLRVVRGTGLCSNSFILSDDSENKILVIDIGLSGRANGFALKKALERIIGKNNEAEIEIFLTHCHVDHILGEDNFEGFQNILFSASPLAARHINARDDVTLLSMFGGEINYRVEKTYSNGEIISFGGLELEVLHTPGHTDGGAVIYSRTDKALFAGDVVFAEGSPGRVDFPTGNRKILISTLEKLATMAIEHLYSGHGPAAHNNISGIIRNAKAALELFW